ncbi:MAG: hypothetical protein NVS9B6_17300 [Candidatus Limnocylindrales bacterium]
MSARVIAWALAALGTALNVRIQSTVDRPFYRSKYDAGRTLDAFTEGLGDEVELEVARARLLDVVGRTLSPAHASLWLRHR